MTKMRFRGGRGSEVGVVRRWVWFSYNIIGCGMSSAVGKGRGRGCKSQPLDQAQRAHIQHGHVIPGER